MGFSKKMEKLLMSLILSLELVLVLDCVAVFFDQRMTPVFFAAVLLAAVLLLFLLGKLTWKRLLTITAGVAAGIVLLCGAALAVWHPFQKTASYQDVNSGKEQAYRNRDVMVIVPHQDDEINILGGVIEEFIQYGSSVRIVYVTNGDYGRIPETRMREAIEYGEIVGIPEENIIFLGYGDRWDVDGGVHIYNAPSGTVVPSFYGAVETYGLESHPAYRQGNPYTVESYLSDMESVILEYKPEVIFCSDYDRHIEHMATTLSFEKVMGKILRENPDYKPLVYKGYAYNSAWYAEADYYRLNILSTRNVFAEPYCNEPAVYRWEDGIRFPVDAGTLSRSLVSSGAYAALGAHDSQFAQTFANSVVNGDRVFWQRRTDSLCSGAEIEVSSGKGEYLNNFMLIDNFDLWEQENPYDSVWIPDGQDPDRTAQVTFPDAQSVYSIVLYDHPSDTENVLNAVIAFDDGSRVESGPLDVHGAATEIVVRKNNVKSFSVTLESTEGMWPGLTEIEALPTAVQGDVAFAKLMDGSGEFAYDYCLPEGTAATFSLYAHGLEMDSVQANCDNDAMGVTVDGREVTVECPVGETGTVTVCDNEGNVLDGIFVSNPTAFRRFQIHFGQTVEEYAVFKLRNSVAFRTGKRVFDLLDGIF